MIAWSVIVPVKPWGLAKSRLEVPTDVRYDVARAMTLDTLEALRDAKLVGSIVVVSADREVRAAAAHLGARLIEDRPLATFDGLNVAVRLGRAWLAKERALAPVAVVPTDLAGLTADALDEMLREVGPKARQHVVDAHGTGTTVMMAPAPRTLMPAYGPDSARDHVALGSRARLDVDDCLRRDVDTTQDWQDFVVSGASAGRHLNRLVRSRSSRSSAVGAR